MILEAKTFCILWIYLHKKGTFKGKGKDLCDILHFTFGNHVSHVMSQVDRFQVQVGIGRRRKTLLGLRAANVPHKQHPNLHDLSVLGVSFLFKIVSKSSEWQVSEQISGTGPYLNLKLPSLIMSQCDLRLLYFFPILMFFLNGRIPSIRDMIIAKLLTIENVLSQ